MPRSNDSGTTGASHEEKPAAVAARSRSVSQLATKPMATKSARPAAMAPSANSSCRDRPGWHCSSVIRAPCVDLRSD